MSKYTPDNWVVIDLSSPEHGEIKKVLAGWTGSYTDSDYWKLNSGITETRDMGDYYEFDGYSGSTYICYKNRQHLSLIMSDVFIQIEKAYPTAKIINYE